MEIRELRSFCVAARLRSISKAAESLDLGQPAVSTHIKKLERELGTPLFDRVRRPIRLTLAGQKLAELATPLIDGVDALATSAAQAEAEGPVIVAATPDLIAHFMMRAVAAFRVDYPKVHLQLRSRLRADVIQTVSEGDADFGIVPGAESAADIEFEGLFPYERVLIAPQGHALLLEEPLNSIERIAAHPLIMMGPHTYTRTSLESEFQRRGLSYDIMLEVDSMDLIKRYVTLGYGVSIVPRIVIDPEDERSLGAMSLSHLLPVDLVGMATLRGRVVSTPALEFMEAVRAAAQDL